MIANKVGTKSNNIITYNRPVNVDDLLYKTTPKNETDIRTKNDLVSYFQKYQRTNGKNITIDSNTMNPIYEHMPERINNYDNIQIGSGIKKGLFTKNLILYNNKHNTNYNMREFAEFVKNSNVFSKAIKKRATFYLNFN